MATAHRDAHAVHPTEDEKSMTWPPYGKRLLALAERDLKADVLRNMVRSRMRSDLEVIASLWLTEGIPHAFAEHPVLYEHIRRALGSRLDVAPKNISITGSRRTGYSMDPSKWGVPSAPASDFDLFVVDPALFKAVAEEFGRWSEDFRAGKCVPTREAEKEWWPANADEGPANIARGFLAPLMRTPLRPEYPTGLRISAALTATTSECRRLAAQLGAGDIFAATPRGKSPLKIRVYEDWRRAIDGVTSSLAAAGWKLRKLDAESASHAK